MIVTVKVYHQEGIFSPRYAEALKAAIREYGAATLGRVGTSIKASDFPVLFIPLTQGLPSDYDLLVEYQTGTSQPNQEASRTFREHFASVLVDAGMKPFRDMSRICVSL